MIKPGKILTEHFDIDDLVCIFEALMPDGRYIYMEFTQYHKIAEKITWRLI